MRDYHTFLPNGDAGYGSSAVKWVLAGRDEDQSPAVVVGANSADAIDGDQKLVAGMLVLAPVSKALSLKLKSQLSSHFKTAWAQAWLLLIRPPIISALELVHWIVVFSLQSASR